MKRRFLKGLGAALLFTTMSGCGQSTSPFDNIPVGAYVALNADGIPMPDSTVQRNGSASIHHVHADTVFIRPPREGAHPFLRRSHDTYDTYSFHFTLHEFYFRSFQGQYERVGQDTHLHVVEDGDTTGTWIAQPAKDGFVLKTDDNVIPYQFVAYITP